VRHKAEEGLAWGKLLQSLFIFTDFVIILHLSFVNRFYTRFDVGTSKLIYNFLIISHFYKDLNSRVLGNIV